MPLLAAEAAGVKLERALVFKQPAGKPVRPSSHATQGIDAKADNAGVVIALGAIRADPFDRRNGRTEPSASVVAEFCAR